MGAAVIPSVSGGEGPDPRLGSMDRLACSAEWHQRRDTRRRGHLVVLEPVQEDVEVERSNVVADKNVRIELAQAREQVHEQRALAGLRAEHAAPVAPPHLARVCRRNRRLKACAVTTACHVLYPDSASVCQCVCRVQNQS